MSPRILASLTAAFLAACHASEDGNTTPRCAVDSDCPADLVCYRTFCIAGDGNGEDIDDVAVDDDAGLSGPVASDASATPPDASGGGTSVTAPVPGDMVASPPDAAAPTPPAPTPPAPKPAPTPVADAGVPPASQPDSGSTPQPPMPPGSVLPWPLGVPLDGLACLAPCTVFDEKGCRECVQKTLRIDPETLCGREKGDKDDDDDDDDDALNLADPGFLGLRSAICTTLCLGTARSQGLCRRSK